MLRRQIGSSLAVLLTFLLPLAAAAQSLTCVQPGVDAAECRRFHYHVRAWQLSTRTSVEVAATTGFGTRAACDKAREQAQKANLTFADQMRTAKIDGKFEADVFGDCHCDRTGDPASRSFLDDAARLRQRRALLDIMWQVRTKLLASAANPNAGRLMTTTWPRKTVFDRFLTEKLTALAPPEGGVKPLPLLPTRIPASSSRRAIASGLQLLQLDAPAPRVARPNAEAPPPVAPATDDPLREEGTPSEVRPPGLEKDGVSDQWSRDRSER